MIFVEEPDLNKKVAHITCHEMTHAFSAALKLPLWMNEGIAMVAVDRFMGYTTVRSETLARLNCSQHRWSVGKYRNLSGMEREKIVYHYVRGYWITRFLTDGYPDLMKELLTKKLSHQSIERKVAVALDIDYRNLWGEIDERVLEHFKEMWPTGEQSIEPKAGRLVPPVISKHGPS